MIERLRYVVAKFKITAKDLGVTAHGLRHEALIEEFVSRTGVQPPVRGGEALPVDVERKARVAVAALAGHCRTRVASAYLGQSRKEEGGKAASSAGLVEAGT